MEIIIARSLNGVPMTPDEMKQYTFTSDVVNKTIADVNRRISQQTCPKTPIPTSFR